MRSLIVGLTAMAAAFLVAPHSSDTFLVAPASAAQMVCQTQTIADVQAKLPPQGKVMEIPAHLIEPVLAQFGAAVPTGGSRMFFIQVDDRGLIVVTDAAGCGVAAAAGTAKTFYSAMERVIGTAS